MGSLCGMDLTFQAFPLWHGFDFSGFQSGVFKLGTDLSICEEGVVFCSLILFMTCFCRVHWLGSGDLSLNIMQFPNIFYVSFLCFIIYPLWVSLY